VLAHPGAQPYWETAAQALANEGGESAVLLLRRARDDAPDEAWRARFTQAARSAAGAPEPATAGRWDALVSNVLGGGLCNVVVRQHAPAGIHVAHLMLELPDAVVEGAVVPGLDQAEAARMLDRFTAARFEFAPARVADALAAADPASHATIQAGAALSAQALAALQFVGRAPRGEAATAVAPARHATAAELHALLQREPYSTWLFLNAEVRAAADADAGAPEIAALVASQPAECTRLVAMARQMSRWHSLSHDAAAAALLTAAVDDVLRDAGASALVQVMAERTAAG
jgi:hypothetical protein